ncbi:MAG TPA: class B sortase [Bacilli bacterium]|nr:class B sortase [Bacilli bacterium]
MNKNYEETHENEEYIPKHASDYNYSSPRINRNWNEDFKNELESDSIINNDYKSQNILDNLDKIDHSKYYIVEEPKKESPKGKKNTRKRKNKKWPWVLLLIVLFAIIVVCLVKIVFWLKDNKTTSEVVNDITNNTNIEEKKDDENTELVNKEENTTSDYWYYIKFPLIDVDINKLKEKNSDTVGWINVNNTNINYPYVQGKDNNYYLDHSFNKKYNEAGWVFLDYRNDKNLSNKNNILYAHSRLDKTMFGSLSKTLKSNWYNNKDNHIIRLSTETENTMWQIFSVYKIPEETYYITTNFNSDNDYQKFLNTIKERSIHNFSTNLTTNDKILTLSTCYSDTERTVVHAKLIKRSQK